MNSGSILPGTVGREWCCWLSPSTRQQEAVSYANEASIPLKQALIPEASPGAGTTLVREGLRDTRLAADNCGVRPPGLPQQLRGLHSCLADWLGPLVARCLAWMLAAHLVGRLFCWSLRIVYLDPSSLGDLGTIHPVRRLLSPPPEIKLSHSIWWKFFEGSEAFESN